MKFKRLSGRRLVVGLGAFTTVAASGAFALAGCASSSRAPVLTFDFSSDAAKSVAIVYKDDPDAIATKAKPLQALYADHDASVVWEDYGPPVVESTNYAKGARAGAEGLKVTLLFKSKAGVKPDIRLTVGLRVEKKVAPALTTDYFQVNQDPFLMGTLFKYPRPEDFAAGGAYEKVLPEGYLPLVTAIGGRFSGRKIAEMSEAELQDVTKELSSVYWAAGFKEVNITFYFQLDSENYVKNPATAASIEFLSLTISSRVVAKFLSKPAVPELGTRKLIAGTDLGGQHLPPPPEAAPGEGYKPDGPAAYFSMQGQPMTKAGVKALTAGSSFKATWNFAALDEYAGPGYAVTQTIDVVAGTPISPLPAATLALGETIELYAGKTTDLKPFAGFASAADVKQRVAPPNGYGDWSASGAPSLYVVLPPGAPGYQAAFSVWGKAVTQKEEVLQLPSYTQVIQRFVANPTDAVNNSALGPLTYSIIYNIKQVAQ